MTETTNKLKQLLKRGLEYLYESSEAELNRKVSPEKWSKKEILGHLIDSGINNLQRFTEIQFENKPYPIRDYKQNELVKANDYQNAKTKELIAFWLSINNRILRLIELQTESTLNYKIELSNNKLTDLRYLITDYVTHLEHHLNQIIKTNSIIK